MTKSTHPMRQAGSPVPHRYALISGFVSLAVAAMSNSVHAQDASASTSIEVSQAALPGSAPAAASSASGAEKNVDTQQVVVTANRRREPAREVPMQVDVVNTQRLERGGAHDLVDYVAGEAGVDVKSLGGPGQGAINIRGVSTGNQSIATVAIYLDDVPFGSSSAFALGSSTALDMALLDLNHIEVLKGPQGTLYGASSMGGLLKYVTNEPDTGELSGHVTVGASATRFGAPGYTVSGIVNVPIKEDVAAVRVSAFRDHAGGYVDAVGPAAGKDVNHGDTTGGRISALVEPTNRFKVRLTATAQDIRRDGLDEVDYDSATHQPSAGDLKQNRSLREPYSLKLGVGTLDLEYTVSGVRFNSISSVQSFRLSTNGDLTDPYAPALKLPAGSSVPSHQAVDVHKQTQEFRFTSTEKGAFEWLGGLFYTHETGGNQQLVDANVAGTTGQTMLASVSLPSAYKEIAGYGDLTWNATHRLALTAGLRIAHNSQSYRQLSDGPLAGGLSASPPANSAETSRTYLATARYALTPVSNVYLRAASGYRPGGPNSVLVDPVTGVPQAPPTFQHDDLWSYEGGYKADLLDKTLSVEASMYLINWRQIQNVEAINGIGVIVNDGRARIKGLELNVGYRPTADWNLTSNLSYIDARSRDTIPNLATAGGRLPNSPEFAATLGLNRNFSLDGNPAYAGLTERYVGERDAGFPGSTTIPSFPLASYFLTDLVTGVTWGRYDISAYVRNVFDKRALTGADTGLVALGGPVQAYLARPRTIGASLSVAF